MMAAAVRFSTPGPAVKTMSADGFGKFFHDQTALWAKIIRDNNVESP